MPAIPRLRGRKILELKIAVIAGGNPSSGEYSKIASSYDARWSWYVRATIQETLRRLPSLFEDRILDVGCGTGELLLAIQGARPDATLAGIDPTKEMLEIAKAKLPLAELKEAGAENIPFPEESFDLVVSTSVFHLLSDPRQALKEMFRVLKPGGRIVLTDWCDDYLACRLWTWILRGFGRSRLRIYGQEECRRLLEGANFKEISVERYKISWLWGLMTASGRKKEAVCFVES